MNQRLCIALALLGTGAISLDAQVDITVRAYHKWKAAEASCKLEPACIARSDIDKSASSTYLKGMGDGFVWANADLAALHRNRLYCAPEELGMNSDNYDQILESFLPKMGEAWRTLKNKDWKTLDDVPAGFALLMALTNAFPCGEDSKQ
jgi:hypothetical protein